MNEARIKDFSITGLQMMESTDGYAIRCRLSYRDRSLGMYFDKGDGSDYYFYPENGHTQAEVEDMLTGEDFPPIDNLLPDLPPLSWNIGILVEELIERHDLDERIAKAKKEGRDLILVTDMAKGERCVVTFRSHAPEEAVAMYVRMNYGEHASYVRY